MQSPGSCSCTTTWPAGHVLGSSSLSSSNTKSWSAPEKIGDSEMRMALDWTTLQSSRAAMSSSWHSFGKRTRSSASCSRRSLQTTQSVTATTSSRLLSQVPRASSRPHHAVHALPDAARSVRVVRPSAPPLVLAAASPRNTHMQLPSRSPCWEIPLPAVCTSVSTASASASLNACGVLSNSRTRIGHAGCSTAARSIDAAAS
mmetsp:Transcript_20937/g.55580  ORF Transcript_20937/g.55580 Transcript_20937/m.55580 type:complete len:202 (-) Transcript_20937:264-869(-)